MMEPKLESGGWFGRQCVECKCNVWGEKEDLFIICHGCYKKINPPKIKGEPGEKHKPVKSFKEITEILSKPFILEGFEPDTIKGKSKDEKELPKVDPQKVKYLHEGVGTANQPDNNRTCKCDCKCHKPDKPGIEYLPCCRCTCSKGVDTGHKPDLQGLTYTHVIIDDVTHYPVTELLSIANLKENICNLEHIMDIIGANERLSKEDYRPEAMTVQSIIDHYKKSVDKIREKFDG